MKDYLGREISIGDYVLAKPSDRPGHGYVCAAVGKLDEESGSGMMMWLVLHPDKPQTAEVGDFFGEEAELVAKADGTLPSFATAARVSG